ncbi:L,D-transpeptidase family protein [Phreatobacter oligotrophus]|uniref:Murein L,D-transpeptidase YafK n=1 Tax=Phreatobacter oligotrophus TaxID=1122261 RepID=A0A2T4ZE79_9HYPH|nr:murein L,D-transpeptidase family protein [Phreatobacter oligotrophus]PTM60199.1 murein L,D-transpeptidase YafK [Phreatobacter oligotrophus]
MAALLAACQGETVSRNDPNRGNRPLAQAVVEELNVKGMTRTSPVLMRIFKEEAELEVWKRDATGRYALFKTYPICNYSGDLGPKVREGDRQSPEGFYQINMGLMNPRSSYYLAFNMGFPNQFDRSYGRTGSHLMVHGDCSSRGCYAMTDEAIAEVYALAREALQAGQDSFQVQAYPFRMTPRNLARHRNNPNMTFWKNLKEGYDHFEVTRQEPQVDVCERRYVFNAVSPQSVLAQGGVGETREMIAANDPWAGTRNASTARANVSTSAAPATPVPTSVNQPVTTMAPVTREAPARNIRTRFTAVGDDTSAPRPNFQAASACPAYVVPPPIRQAVAAKHARDMAQVAALSREVAAAPPRSGIDGGTHRTFASRFTHRQIRVGSSEPTFSLASQQSEPVTLVSARAPVAAAAPAPAAAAPTAPALASASSTPVTLPAAAAPQQGAPALEASVASAITAPVPVPSPLRTTVAARSSGPVQAPTVSAFAPEPAPAPAPQGNWLSRTMGSIGLGQAQGQAPAPAASEPPQVANQGGARN